MISNLLSNFISFQILFVNNTGFGHIWLFSPIRKSGFTTIDLLKKEPDIYFTTDTITPLTIMNNIPKKVSTSGIASPIITPKKMENTTLL